MLQVGVISSHFQHLIFQVVEDNSTFQGQVVDQRILLLVVVAHIGSPLPPSVEQFLAQVAEKEVV